MEKNKPDNLSTSGKISHLSFKQLYELINEGIMLTDASGIIKMMNPAGVRFMGYESEDEITGKSVTDFYINPEFRDLFIKQLIESGGRLNDYIFPIKTKNGKEKKLSCNIQAITDKGGNLEGILTANRDLSDIERLKEELREKNLFAESVGEIIEDLIAIADSEGTVINTSRSYRILGYEPEELTGFNIFKNIHPDDINFVNAEWDKFINTPGSKRIEYRYLCKDMSFRWLETIAKPFASSSSEKQYIFCSRDITERKLSERKFKEIVKRNQALLDTSPACHKIIDLDFNLRYMSLNGFKMLKLSENDNLYGKPYPFDFFPEAFRREMKNKLFEVKNTGSQTRFEAPGSDIEGNEIWFDNVIIPVFSDNFTVEYFVVVSNNTTERNRMEKQLRHMEKMDAIGHLAGGVAHDFNNQLTGVLGYADLLIRNLEDPKLKKYAENICSAAKRSRDLTVNLLSFSRKEIYKTEYVDVNKLINETSEFLRRSVDKKISIHQNLNARESVIAGDSSQLQNALLNLGINARDAMPDGGELVFETRVVKSEEIQKSLNNLPADYSFLEIRVGDTGGGIPVQAREHIFEPFFTTKEQGKGTGMGLSSVYGTVNQHKGIITFESKISEGTVFYIYLPLAEYAYEDEKITDNMLSLEKKLNILVIDDEKLVRDLISEFLAVSGHSVIECRNGKEAVSVYKDKWKEIDLVILDMIMPEMDGRETLKHLRAINSGVKIIIASGYSDNKKGEKLPDTGTLGFINKPFNYSQLNDIISSIQSR